MNSRRTCRGIKKSSARRQRGGPDYYLIACWQEVIDRSKEKLAELSKQLDKGTRAIRNPNLPVPTLSTIERLLDEVAAHYASLNRLRQEQKRLQPGSKKYLDFLPELVTELDVLELKAKHAAQGIEDFEESLPEDDSV